MIVTDYLIGFELEELRTTIKKNWKEAEARAVWHSAAQALGELHRINNNEGNGMIHRDLHFRNMMITFDDLKPSTQ